MLSADEVDRLSALDARVVQAAKGIKLLGRLSWDIQHQRCFLADWARGRARLPEPSYSGPDLGAAIDELIAVRGLVQGEDPLSRYLVDTTDSYMAAGRLIQAAGTAGAQEFSRLLFGLPGDSLSGGRLSNLDAARHFLEVTDAYEQQEIGVEPEYCVPAEVMRRQIEARLEEVFERGRINVVIDPSMASKAAAGATRVRLRSGTCFSPYDLEQLLQHEAFVHSLTALNGRAQARFGTLGLGAPRTTRAQEGLATFAELVTGAIDIKRMERIALRVMAVGMALDGANFIDVFRFFLDRRQPEVESFNSAMRVFRGAPLEGGYAFTKDVVYLHGMMEVHTFFRWSLLHERLGLTHNFLAGRMSIDDAVALDPLFADGTLSGPRYLPPWMTRINGLAGYLAFSVLANRIRIDALGEGHIFDSIDELHPE